MIKTDSADAISSFEEAMKLYKRLCDKKRSDNRAIIARKHLDYIRLNSLDKVPPFRFPAYSFEIISRHGLPVYMTTTTGMNISMTADKVNRETIAALRSDFSETAEMVIENDVAILFILAGNARHTLGESRIIGMLKDIPILMISYNNDSISVAIRGKDCAKAIEILTGNLLEAGYENKGGLRILREDFEAFVFPEGR